MIRRVNAPGLFPPPARAHTPVAEAGPGAGPRSSTLIGVARPGHPGPPAELIATAVVPEGDPVVSGVLLRRAVAADARAAADVWLRSFAAALPTVVRPHTDDGVRDYFRDVVVPSRVTWVAQAPGGAIVGVMVLDGAQLSQLYLDPGWRGRGIGDRFVALAKERRPDGLTLWTFQVNEPAHRFYERHGFTAVESTDGSGNEEREPDVRYVWRPEA